ncbi:MAG TPA: lycopene cyclase domain-containing protein [Bacteroidales bacterium]|nr:lycopene cyclase domain-containing protein [Bacteroidales bacterium]HOX76826.1 lycopene cyclase domain-containing protein [Bacteroidales bacterium]HPI86298.1 lycopene cyclase domain-containing protein [Bacteroidales bacterium]HPM92154.1 lycopene cyclase domain-containing protein [Bacteroidales bacterium]
MEVSDGMEWQKFTYALLLAGSVLIPFILSFDKKVAFFRNWKYLFPATLITAAVFIIWDIYFTKHNVWWFNKDFVTGLFIQGLPVEEWLFFIIIPYCCIFIYEVSRAYLKKEWKGFIIPVNIILFIIFLVITLVNIDRIYTAVNFGMATFIIGLQFFLKTHKTWMFHFYVAYALSLIPFFLVNGVLTSMPVVGYNDEENLAMRIYTIPVEDFAYLVNLLLMNLTLYEFFKSRSLKRR